MRANLLTGTAMALALTSSSFLIANVAFAQSITNATMATSSPTISSTVGTIAIAGLAPGQIESAEQNIIAQFNADNNVQSYSASPDGTAQSIAEQNAYVAQLQAESTTPEVQQQLTENWRAQNQENIPLANTNTVSPDTSVNPPVGSIEITTTYDASLNIHVDANESASDLSTAYTIAEDILSYFLSNVGSIVEDVVEILGRSINTSDPVSSELYHTYTYGYEDAYIWNGNNWVLSLTTGDREWYRHATISYIPPDATYAVGYTYNWVPSEGYGPIHTDYSSLWNNTSLLEQEAESNYNEGVYEFVPWYD
jgi:hypothetical protein